MRSRLKRGYASIIIAAAAIALLALSMTAPFVSTTTDFSIYNSGWNGTSGLAKLTYEAGKFSPTFKVESSGTDVGIVQRKLAELDLDPSGSALVIVGPTKTFSPAEGKLVGDFVRSGGMLFLADDFGTGNILLEGMKAASRFSGDLVMDLAFEKQPEFSVCYGIREHEITRNVSTLLLNYPSSLEISPSNTTALAYSSLASWRDTNENGLEEWGEPRGPFPVLALEKLGLGTIVLLSDPSVLINGMTAYMDDGVLANNLLDYVSSDRTSVYFDESHRDYFDPVTITVEITESISGAAKAAIVGLAFVLALWVSTDYVNRALSRAYGLLRDYLGRIVSFFSSLVMRGRAAPQVSPPSEDELLERVKKDHPDWRIGVLTHALRQRKRHGEALRSREL